MKLIDAAVEYARRGRAVFPTAGKVPRTAHGLKDATTDESTIIAWWSQWPTAGIGLVTGNGIIAVDVDGDAGRESLRELELKHGALPATLVNVTARGVHHIYREPDGVRLGNRAGLRPGIDLRAGGGYVVVWPSRHPSGHIYRWEHASIVKPPKWLVDVLVPPPAELPPVAPCTPVSDDRGRAWALAGLDRLAGDVSNATPGTRNHTLNRCACSAGKLVGAGFISRAEAVDALGTAAVRAGLRAREIRLVLREGGALEVGAAHPSRGPLGDRAGWIGGRRAA